MAVAIALLVVVELLGQRSTTAIGDNARSVQHTLEVIERLDALLIADLDAETSRSRLALTGDETQIGEARAAAARALVCLDDLRRLCSDNPAQVKRLDDVEPVIRARLDRIARAIAIHRAGGFDQARDGASAKEGMLQKQTVRAGIAALVAEERRLLEARERTTRESLSDARVIQLAGTLMSIALFVAVLVRLRREAQRRKESETRARQNEEDLAITIQSIGDGVIATDADGRVQRMNAVAEALTGWTVADARGRPSTEVFHLVNDVTGKDMRHPVEKALHQGATIEIDDAAVLVAKNGEKRRVADSAAPIRSADGGEPRGVVLVFHDITQTLEDARSLRRAHAFLDSIVENIPNMIFVKEAQDLSFVRFNRAGELLLGAKREELFGKSDRDFFPPDQAAAFVAKDRETLRAKAVLDIPEEPLTTPHGIRWLHTMKVPILDEEGEPEYLLGISEDITERRQGEVKLRASMDATEVAHRELEAFSYSVAHDLRAPLRSIDGFSQALLDDYAEKLDDQGKDYLHRVRNSARRMAELIDDLLALARVSRSDLVRTNVDITTIARQVGEEARKQGNPTAVLDVADNLKASADVRLVRVLLENLLSNAFKFSAKRADARVEIGTRPEGGGTAFYVRDNGAGFDVGAAKKLFTAFQRYHRPTEYEGTGIGLATGERIVSRHGGRIWVESAPGAGATFFFMLERGGATK